MGSVPLRISDHRPLCQFWCLFIWYTGNFGVLLPPFCQCQFRCLFILSILVFIFYTSHTRAGYYTMMVRDGCWAILIYIDLDSQFGFTELICHQYLQCASPIISKDGSEDSARAYFRVCASVAFQKFPLSTVVVYRSRYSS